MNIQYLGHSCFLIDDGSVKLLTDPFLSGDPLAAADPDEICADFILVSHDHHDHLGDTAAIAKRCGATVCCTVGVDTALSGSGIRVLAGNIGGKIKLPFGSVKLFQAVHSIYACGFIIELGGKRIYFAGDTALISDMALLADENIDLALLPIGDHYTMGPGDALRAVKMIRPGITVPMHYNTFPLIKQDPVTFADAVRAAGFEAEVLKPGEKISL